MSWMTSALVTGSFVTRPRLITGKACDDGDDTRGTCALLAMFAADVHAERGTYRPYMILNLQQKRTADRDGRKPTSLCESLFKNEGWASSLYVDFGVPRITEGFQSNSVQEQATEA